MKVDWKRDNCYTSELFDIFEGCNSISTLESCLTFFFMKFVWSPDSRILYLERHLLNKKYVAVFYVSWIYSCSFLWHLWNIPFSLSLWVTFHQVNLSVPNSNTKALVLVIGMQDMCGEKVQIVSLKSPFPPLRIPAEGSSPHSASSSCPLWCIKYGVKTFKRHNYLTSQLSNVKTIKRQTVLFSSASNCVRTIIIS